MPPSDVREQHEYLDLLSKSPGSHVQLSEGFELTEHSRNELGNGRVSIYVRSGAGLFIIRSISGPPVLMKRHTSKAANARKPMLSHVV